jgi:hypothetical protein
LQLNFVVLVDLMVKRIRENCMLNAGLDISSGEVKHATARAKVKFNRWQWHTYTAGISLELIWSGALRVF